ncbi:autoinducer binding domain-containing protein [Yoonia sp. R2331]|uniref:autoinducer binding domain-containing protein n=1 Tax=Yoonia sp. R2331 TaxID=3237238 RepID=UPI0034E3E414
MTIDDNISQTLSALKEKAPVGYALAFHIRFTTPTFLFQSYPKAWTDYYSQNGLVMSDPTVAWGFENLGTKRWSELAENDPADVMGKAAEHGLAYGVTIAVEADESRSLSSFARGDREFDAVETAALEADVRRLHEMTAQISALSPDLAQELRKMSVIVAAGGEA